MSTKNQAEQSLSDLSLTELGDRLPGLMPYLLGFELITSNDEKTRAAGILGFDIGGQELLIPCLFLNGRIRGMEIMYLSDTDTFTSASSQWVEYLTSRGVSTTGGPDAAGDRVGTVPSAALRIFNREPQITKRAAEEAGGDLVEYWANIDKATAPARDGFDFISVLRKMGKTAYLNFMGDIADSHPDVFTKIAEYYDVNVLGGIEFDTPPRAETKTASAQPKLAFITRHDLEAQPGKYADDVKLDVMRNGLTVIDKRAAEDKSEWYTDDYTKSFQSPPETGIYSFINVYGKLSDVFIAHQPFDPEHPTRSSNRDVLVDPSSHVFRETREHENILVRSYNSKSEDKFQDFYKSLSRIGSAAVGKSYILLSSARGSSIPFKVINKTVEDGNTTLTIQTDNWAFGLKGDDNDIYTKSIAPANGDCRHFILVLKGGEERTERFGNTTGYGADWRILPVEDRPEYTEKDYNAKYEKWQEKRDVLRAANAQLIIDIVQGKGIIDLKTLKKEGKYVIQYQDRTSRLMSKNAAVVYLTGGLGLSYKTARSIVDPLVNNGDLTHGWIKTAQIYSGMPFPDTDQRQGINDLGVMEEMPFTQAETVPMNNPPVPDDFNTDAANYDKIKKQDVDFLMRASDTNSKAVFDPAMIGVLLKTNRTQLQIDQWVPDLVGALDKLCRLLLLFYWKNADFAESYGNDDMAELEDVLLNNIKNLGTIVLFLKQRANESPGTKIDAFSGN